MKSIEFLIPQLDNGIKANFWIGLINPMGEACEDADCKNTLSWVSDGSSLTTMHSAKVSSDNAKLDEYGKLGKTFVVRWFMTIF